ncbi:hypothetical protein T492DRAFT_851045 [Pavlovales sp. CCMP2436]|nr:hypothetical protein T492DRAFT_851045 [Pavlovales sp. CCMP2436]
MQNNRLYTAFETPTKLFKLRQPFGELMRTPAPYIHGRVSADCVLALTRMASTLQMERLRDVHKGSLWMPAIAVLDLEKKFGARAISIFLSSCVLFTIVFAIALLETPHFYL